MKIRNSLAILAGLLLIGLSSGTFACGYNSCNDYVYSGFGCNSCDSCYSYSSCDSCSGYGSGYGSGFGFGYGFGYGSGFYF